MENTGRQREETVYNAVTKLFLGVPATTAVPVLCEALIHALNCTERECRAEMTEVAIATIEEHVDLSKAPVLGYAT